MIRRPLRPSFGPDDEKRLIEILGEAAITFSNVQASKNSVLRDIKNATRSCRGADRRPHAISFEAARPLTLSWLHRARLQRERSGPVPLTTSSLCNKISVVWEIPNRPKQARPTR